ncbi:MAG: hypothetical protein EBQ96_03815 [Proteobacteria bacterium]|nr:hypothetical protein [Pseudomonadota bacterium]
MRQKAVSLFNDSDSIYSLVRAALEDCGIDCDRHHVFRYFVSLSLSPENIEHGRKALNEGDVSRSIALANLALYLDTASEHGAPDFVNINELSDPLLCAIAMRALPSEDGYFPRAHRILSIGDFRPFMDEARGIYLEAAHFHANGALNSTQYKAMSPATRLVSELHAVHLCERALEVETTQTLYPLLREVAPYGPLLAQSDTAMARHFKGLFDRLSTKVPDLAVPLAAANSGGASSAKLHVFTGRRPAPPRL